MPFVRRANVMLEVDAEAVQRMLDSGFDEVDSTGRIITKSVPFDATELRRLYIQSLAEIKALKEELTQLKTTSKDVAETEAVVKTKRSKKSE